MDEETGLAIAAEIDRAEIWAAFAFNQVPPSMITELIAERALRM